VNKKFRKELSSGIVSLVLLSVLDRAAEPMYGYQIAKLVGAGGAETPMVKQGALYPVLRSLERSGLLQSRVEPSVSGPPRRYYSVTESGRKTLGQWTEIWGETKAFVDSVLGGVTND
jgi:PadR family transcriptional regulator PadR